MNYRVTKATFTFVDELGRERAREVCVENAAAAERLGEAIAWGELLVGLAHGMSFVCDVADEMTKCQAGGRSFVKDSVAAEVDWIVAKIDEVRPRLAALVGD